MRKPVFSLLLTLFLVMASAMGINAQTSNDTLLNADFNATSGTALPAGWDTCRWVAGTTTTTLIDSYRWKSNTGGVNSSRCAYLYAYQSYTLQHGLMTPARQFSSTEDYRICFDLKNYTTTSTTYSYLGGDMNIYVTLDDGVTIIDTIAEHISTGANWTHYEYAIPSSYVQGQNNVRILFIGKSYHYYYLDNVMILTAKRCKPAADIVLSTLTTTGATFTWSIGQGITGNEQNPTGYVVNVYTKSGDSLVFTQNVATEAITLTTLLANTEYVIKVASDCGTAGAGEPAAYEFKTLSTSASLPYYLDFESGIPSECYTKNVVTSSGSSYVHQGVQSIKLTTTATEGAKFFTRMLNVNANNAEVDLWIKPSVAGKEIKFGFTDNPYSDDYFVPVLSFTPTSANWQEVRFNTASVSSQQNPVMIGMYVDAGTSFTLYVDSIHVHVIPSCTRPENITATAKTHNSITLGWNMSTASSHHIVAVSGSDTVFNQTVAATNSYTITGLTPNTNYHIAVAAVCSANDESEFKQMADSVRTYCDIATLTEMSEGAEDAVTGKLPDCWTTGIISEGTGTSGSIYTDYPFNVTTTKHSGSKGFQLRSMKAGAVSYLSSQQRNFGTTGQYTVSLWVNRTTTSKQNEGIDLWVTPSVGDTTGGCHLGMINRYNAAAPVEATTGWFKYEYVINYSGNGYLTFIGKSQYGAATYFDDIEIFETPNCAHVTNLATGSVSGSSIDISWTAGGSETQWQVGYAVTASGVRVASDTAIVNATTFTISGLQASSSYVLNASVRAICGSDTAAAETITNHAFTTSCAAISTLPYTMGFEENETFLDYSTTYYYPLCWSRYNDASSALYQHYPYVSTSSSYAHTGSRGLYDVSSSTSTSYAANSIVILPDIDTTQYDVNNLRVKFWAKESSSSYSINLYLGVMTDITNFSTFTVVDTVLVTGTTWTLYEMDLSGYTGNGTHIGINFSKAGTASSYSYTYLDDLTLDEIPTCADLQSSVVALSDLGQSSCKLTLQDQTAASSWQYACGVSGTAVSSMTPVDVATDTVTISGLTPATGYDLYIRRSCGGGDYGAWSDLVSFTTTAVPATMPYVCGFEDNTENSNWITTTKASQYYGFTIGADTNGVYSGLKAMYVTNGNGAYTYSTTATSNAGRAFAYRTMRFEAKGYQIDLKWKSTGGESLYDFGRILVTDASTALPLTNQNANIDLNFSTVAQVDTGISYTSGTTVYRALNCSTYLACSPDAEGWCSMSYYLDMTNAPGNYNLVLMWNQDASAGNASYPLAVDEISITELNCIPASTVIATPATTTASLTIQQNSVLGWEVIVDDEPINTDSITATSQYLYRQQTTTNVVNLTGLTANTRYYYTLRTLCQGSNISDWREVENFTTNCAASTVPYTEGFESLTSVNCWHNLSATPETNTLSRETDQHHSGSASMKSVGTSAVTPEFSVDSLTNYQLTGWVYSSVDTLPLSVKVGNDPTDVSAFSEDIFSENIISKDQWHEFTIYFDSLSSPSFSEDKTSRYILLNCGTATAYFDDIELKLAPACRKPNSIVVSNVGSNQFDITFTDNSGASQWIVRCNDGIADIMDTISSTTATVTGLAGHTDYTVSVAALCSSAASDYAVYGTVTTSCDGFDLPWSCGFEPGDGWINTSYVAGDAESNCFNTLNLKADGKAYPTLYPSTTYKQSGSRSLYVYNSSTSSTSAGFLILPAFDAVTNDLKVEYYAKNASTTSTYPDVEFGYMTDISDESSFVLLVTNPKTTTMTKRTHLMSSFSGVPANARLAFRIQKKTGSFYLDDINVSEVRSCSDPNVPTLTSLTATSAKFFISDANQSHTDWEYVCVPSGTSIKGITPTAVPANDTVVLNGLTDNTAYRFLVRAVCDAGDESAWVAAEFTTTCLPFAVTSTNQFVEDFESYAYGLIVSGNTCYDVPEEGVADANRLTVYPKSTPSATSSYFYSHTAPSGLGKCGYFYATNTTAPEGCKVMRDFVFQAGKTYVVSAFVRAGSSGSYTSRFDLLLSDGNTVDTLRTKYMTGASVAVSQYQGKNVYRYDLQFEEVKGFFTAPATGTYSLGIHATNGSTTSSYYYMYLDDWTVTEFNGCMPHSAVLDSVSGANAYFTIDDTIAGHTWEYVLGDTLSGTPVPVSSRSFTVSGLAPSLTYTLYLRTYCSASSHSEWMAIPFNSACGAIYSYPYTQSFEDEFLPNCWSQFYTVNGSTATSKTSENYWARYSGTATSSYVHSGTKAASLPYKANVNTALVTGEFNLNTNPYGYTVSFWMYRYSSTSTTDYSSDILHLMVYDQPITAQNIASATEIAAVHKLVKYDPVESAAGRYQYEYDVPAQFLGGNAYFALYHTVTTGYSTLYVDDFVITEIPSCRTPKSAPEIVGTTKNTVTASFDMAGKDSICFGWAPYSNGVTYTDIIDSLTSVTASATIAGLDSATNYALFARYLCGGSDRSVWSPYARFTTRASDCFAPENVHTVGMVDNAHATIAWNGAPEAVGYEYVLSRNNLPEASGTVSLPSVTFDSLTALSAYTFTVRGICQGDTTSWITFNFSTTAVPMAMPYFTDFEDDSRDGEWLINNPVTTTPNRFLVGAGASMSGDRSMYVSNDNAANYYQFGSVDGVAATSFSYAAVLLPFTAGDYMVSYNWRCMGEGFSGTTANDFGRLFLVPAGTNIPNLTYSQLYGNLSTLSGVIPVSKNILNNSASWTSSADVVNIPEDKMYNLVVAWANDASLGTQPPFAIDNLSVQAVSCLPAASATALSVADDQATFSVSRRTGNAGTTLHYAASKYATADSIHSYSTLVPASPSSMADTVTVSGLDSQSQYYFFVRTVCDSASVSPWIYVPFKTNAAPKDMPFICSFEQDADTASWQFVNGEYSWFIINSGTSSTGNRSLYVTDNGSSYSYSSPGSPTSAYGTSYAYVPLSFGPSTYEFDFDWISNGQTTVDFGRAFLAPSNVEFTPDVLYSGLTYTAVPDGWIALDGSKLNLATTWQHRYASVTFTDSVVMNLVFLWRQNYITDNQGPLAIDNIEIREQTCAPVTGVTYSASTNSATLKARHTNQNAQVFWHLSTNNAYTDTVAMGVTDSVFTATNLNSGFRYYIRAAVICNGNDTAHAKSYYFRTACDTIRQFPYFEGFEDYSSGLSDSVWYKDACWKMTKTNTSAYSYPYSSASYTHSGSQCLYVYNSSTSCMQYLAMPMMQNLNGKTISFWHKAASTSAAYSELSFGYAVGSNFTPITTFDKVSSWREYTSTLSGIPAGARLAFKFNGSYGYYLDDIRINDIATTPTIYNDTICFNAPYNNHGLSFNAGALFPGDTTITTTVQSTTPGVADSLITVNINVRQEIATIAYDTICANTPMYIWGADTIMNPTGTAMHTQRFTASCGCDSTVALTLTVLPETVSINRTICQGDSMVLGDTALKYQGLYLLSYQTAQGCTITANVNLIVEDTLQVTSAAICSGDVYTFEGGTYSSAGIYRVPAIGTAGCNIVKELHLTVYPLDSTIVTTFCRGGSIVVAGEVITSDTVFTKTLVNPGVTCTTTYHVTATTDAPVPAQVYDNACEGYLYTGYGLNSIYVDHDTVCYVQTRTADGLCDSITAVNLKYNQTAYGTETADMPSSGTYTWHDRTLTKPGVYTDTLYSASAAGCDSIVTLTLNGATGLDYAASLDVRIVPNPMTAGNTSFVYVDAEVATVEVLNSFGQVVSTFVPTTRPIEVTDLTASGIYYVRLILTDGNVAVQKLIVK